MLINDEADVVLLHRRVGENFGVVPGAVAELELVEEAGSVDAGMLTRGSPCGDGGKVNVSSGDPA